MRAQSVRSTGAARAPTVHRTELPSTSGYSLRQKTAQQTRWVSRIFGSLTHENTARVPDPGE